MRIKQHEQNRYNTYTRTHTMVDLFNYKRQRAFNLKKQKRKKIIDLDHYPNNDYFNNTKNDLLAIKSRISMPLRIFLFYCMSYFFKLKEKRQVYFGIVVVLVCIFFFVLFLSGCVFLFPSSVQEMNLLIVVCGVISFTFTLYGLLCGLCYKRQYIHRQAVWQWRRTKMTPQKVHKRRKNDETPCNNNNKLNNLSH